jgi:hypothetical protein
MTRDDRTSDFVEITNRAPTPLYVLAAPEDRHRSFTDFPIALPPGVGAIYQIVNGQVFTWDSMLNERIYPAPAAGSPQTRPAGWVALSRTDPVPARSHCAGCRRADLLAVADAQAPAWRDQLMYRATTPRTAHDPSRMRAHPSCHNVARVRQRSELFGHALSGAE